MVSTKTEKVLIPINIMENKCQGIAENNLTLLSELFLKTDNIFKYFIFAVVKIGWFARNAIKVIKDYEK